jgi:hypothetical protein
MYYRAEANTMALEDDVKQAMADSVGKSDAEKKEAVIRALGISPDKLSAADVSWLYKAVVGGILAIMLIALVALAWSVLDGNKDTTPDLLLTVFTGSLGALVGLFVRSPGE